MTLGRSNFKMMNYNQKQFPTYTEKLFQIPGVTTMIGVVVAILSSTSGPNIHFQPLNSCLEGFTCDSSVNWDGKSSYGRKCETKKVFRYSVSRKANVQASKDEQLAQVVTDDCRLFGPSFWIECSFSSQYPGLNVIFM